MLFGAGGGEREIVFTILQSAQIYLKLIELLESALPRDNENRPGHEHLIIVNA
jgi:hypothetical protein